MRHALVIILGSGRGTRPYPLTKLQTKPAVPLAGKYRLIDVPISNYLNIGRNVIIRPHPEVNEMIEDENFVFCDGIVIVPKNIIIPDGTII
jgi:ADP-glucose pyrophosphorylase